MIMCAGKEGALRCFLGEGGDAGDEISASLIRHEVWRRQCDEDLTFAGTKNVAEAEMTFVFVGFELAGSEKLAEPAISLTVGWISECLKAVSSDKAYANKK